MTILVTGSAGFIGSNFIHWWFSNSNEPVISIDKLTYAGNLENIDKFMNDSRHIFVEGDIGDRNKVGELLNEYNPRAIINFAAESHVDRSIHGPYEFVHTNVLGTFHLLEAAREYFNQLQADKIDSFRFLQVSTDEVYGSLSDIEPGFTEQTAYKPNSPYSASKAASDHFVRAYYHTYNIPVLTTNCSNNYGPYQFPEKLIPLTLNKALNCQPIPLYGDGMNVRDWLFVDDHCAAIAKVLEHGRLGQTYNIGGNAERTNLEVVQTLCNILDEIVPDDRGTYARLIRFVKDRPGHDHRYAINCQKIENELGWQRKETFVSGIRKTVQWYLDNKAWVEHVISGEYRKWIEINYGRS